MLTKEELIPHYEEFANDVEEFAKFFFPHLLTSEMPPFHKEVYQILPNHKYLAIAAPRGHAKTTLGLIIYPIWFSLFNKLGDISIYSASEDFVIREITGKIRREFENNERLLYFWGDLKTIKWSDSYFVLKNGIAFEGGGITGQLRGGRRGFIGLDDLENIETVESEEQRHKLKLRINKELIPKLLPNGQMIYMGTIIHQLCYLKQLLDIPDNGWEKRIYRAYPSEIEKEGNELWSALYPHSELQDRKKKQGSNAFASEYMNNPISDETAPIKEHQIRYWTELPKQYSCVIALDPAYSEDATSDYKVAVVVAIDQGNNRYLLEYVRTHSQMGEYQDSVINLYLRYRDYLTGVGIPSGGIEKEFFNGFLKKCEERKVQSIPVVELKNIAISAGTSVGVTKKKKRIVIALQPWFEQGKYYIHANHVEAREELLTINSARWDDLVDAMAYAEQILQPVYYEVNVNTDSYEEEKPIDHGTTGYDY